MSTGYDHSDAVSWLRDIKNTTKVTFLQHKNNRHYKILSTYTN